MPILTQKWLDTSSHWAVTLVSTGGTWCIQPSRSSAVSDVNKGQEVYFIIIAADKCCASWPYATQHHKILTCWLVSACAFYCIILSQASLNFVMFVRSGGEV